MRRIIAIDPGTTQSAFCIIESDDMRPKLFGKYSNPYVLAALNGMQTAQIAVIERLACYGMPVGREVLETCEWVGRFSEAACRAGKAVHYVYRQDEKMTLCHNARANDATIKRALIDRFAQHDLRSGKGTKAKPDWFYGFAADVWQAYAVGVTWLDKTKEAKQIET